MTFLICCYQEECGGVDWCQTSMPNLLLLCMHSGGNWREGGAETPEKTKSESGLNKKNWKRCKLQKNFYQKQS